MPKTEVSSDIEVGQIGDTFRLWLVIEARRQGELRLVGQERSISAIEGRLASVLQWSITIMLAFVAVLIQGASLRPAYLAVAICLTVSAIVCGAALWPKTWHPPGYTLSDLRSWSLCSELEVAEATALGYERAILENDRNATRSALLLCIAWSFFSASPVAAFVIWLWA